jgi:hypothetical protein
VKTAADIVALVTLAAFAALCISEVLAWVKRDRNRDQPPRE